MEFKRIFMLICLIVCLFSVAGVCAIDDAMVGENASQISHADDAVMVHDDTNHDDLSQVDDDNLETGFDENLKEVETSVIITNSSFNKYFTSEGELNDNVSEGYTLDFQGTFTGIEYKVIITKPVNIISSTGDAVFNEIGKKDSTGGCFHISSGGSGTNVSDIRFINSAFYITGASNVTVDNISMMADMSGIGQSTGFMCIQAGSRHVTVKNSYFENGGTGSSILTLGYAYYCVIDNNEFLINGSSGNAVYITTFVPAQYTGDAPAGNRIVNNYIHANVAGMFMALVVAGHGNVIDGNIIDCSVSNGISGQSFSTTYDNNYTNNVLRGRCSFSAGENSYVSGNSVEGTMYAGSNSYLKDNLMGGLYLSKPNVVVDNNNITGTVTLENGASNTTLTNNLIYAGVNVGSNNNNLKKNIIDANDIYAIKLNEAGNNVSFNNLTSNNFTGDSAVHSAENNNVHDNSAVKSIIILDNIALDYGSSVNIAVKTYFADDISARIGDENASAGNFTITIPVLDAGTYALTVTTITDGRCLPVSETVNITVNKVDSSLTVYNNITFDYNGVGSIDISYFNAKGVNASVIGQPNANVSVVGNTIAVSGLNAGNYTLSVTTITDGNHNPVTETATVTVNMLKTQLTASAVTTTYNINKDLIITLKDSNGKALSGVNVTVGLNGVNEYTTDGNGQVKVATGDLIPNSYAAKITFNGDNNYDKSSADVKVAVNKASPKLTAKKKTFKKTKKVKKYSVILKDNTGKAIRDAMLKIKIGKKTYTAKTSAKGKAVFKIKKLTKKGKYRAKVIFNGNAFYNKVTKTVKITVK